MAGQKFWVAVAPGSTLPSRRNGTAVLPNLDMPTDTVSASVLYIAVNSLWRRRAAPAVTKSVRHTQISQRIQRQQLRYRHHVADWSGLSRDEPSGVTI